MRHILNNSLSVTVRNTKVVGGSDRKLRLVREGLCYGKEETVRDAEKAARWCRNTFVS